MKRTATDSLDALEAAYNRGWASAEIAAYIEVSPVTVRAWRRGFRSLTGKYLEAVKALPDRPVKTDKFFLKR